MTRPWRTQLGRDNDSSTAMGARHQRIVARTVFGITIAVLLAVAGLPFGLSLAQGAPTVQIINPHPGTSTAPPPGAGPIISDRDQPYHLNTWVNVVPSQPLVEFELDVFTGQVPGMESFSETITIGNAQQNGSNSFSLLWDIPDDIEDSSQTPGSAVRYELRAILYSGFTGPGTGVEVSRDEMEVTITHEGDAGAATVEITYPPNGAAAGVYIKPDGSGGNVIIEGDLSANQAGSVQGYYTKTPPGEEPTWTTCGTASAQMAEDGSKSVDLKCSTAEGDYALDITGVALRVSQPGASPLQTQPAAADAHHVVPYFQRVQSVSLNPAQAGDAAVADCPKIVATALDQQQRPIGTVNIDVHAQGPTDQFKFQTNLGNNATQPPDNEHPPPEAGRTCSGDSKGSNGGQQGEHNVPGGDDIKHVESVNGTNALGQFTFGVTTDAQGVTQLTAFADEDDDDQYCSAEVAGNGSVGWGQAAPGPTGLPTDEDDCPFSTPSPTPSPTPTDSPSGSASTSPSSSPPPPPSHERNISIRLRHGSLIVSGRVTVDDGTNKCRSNVPVKVQRKKKGKFRTKKTVTTNGGGFYSATVKDKRGRYRVVAPRRTVDEDVCLRTAAKRRHRHRR
ncbi:MAG: hypothetical protein ACRDLB_09240 [Actinomycetota bacterium]